MKKIPLSGGKSALVDDEDYQYVSRFRFVHTNNEAFATLHRANMRYVLVPMWAFIVRAQSGKKIAYKNKNALDFRKENLYFVHLNEKQHRLRKRTIHNGRIPTSKFKGVHRHKDNKRIKRWSAQIQKDKHNYFLGFYLTEKEAAIAYNKKAKQLYGKYAYQNKI